MKHTLNKDTIDKIFQHALKEYPYECCGIITGSGQDQTVHLCKNIQDELHSEDPQRYPRDSRTAYVIDRREVEGIISMSKERGEQVIAFYHSHPEHEAFFSEEDVAAQTVFGGPEFPDALHIVISVRDGLVHDAQCYKWDGQGFISTEGCI